jgi:hypothetical protein
MPAEKHVMTTIIKKKEKDRAHLTFDEARDLATEYYNYTTDQLGPVKNKEAIRNRKKLMLTLTGVYTVR